MKSFDYNERVTEGIITAALKERHKKRGDYFASQVKMGQAGSKILDAIAIPVTWSPITVIGYEIKVSKSDFRNDQKYPHYMSTCNLFYFVVPKGLIESNEVPEGVGILEFSNGNLRQVKKALYRSVVVNSDMLLHCIFYKINQYERPMTRQEYLDDLKAKVESKKYGNKITDKFRELERKLSGTKSWHEYDWEKFQKDFKDKFGVHVTQWDVFDYISIENKNHNAAIRLLEQAAKLFEVK